MDPVERISIYLKKKYLDKAVLEAVDYACCLGILMRTRSKPATSQVVQHAPFTLLPSPVPRNLFEQALAVQQDFNFLMHSISQDHEFLKTAFETVIENDEFTKKLFRVYETAVGEKPKKAAFSIIRSDYMFHKPGEDPPSLKQVEVNMIASGLGGVGAEKMRSLHNFSLKQAGLGDMVENTPENNALTNLAQGMVKAWEVYGNEFAIVVFIVTSSEYNIFDQRTLEYKIYEIEPKIVIRRYLLADVEKFGNLNVDGKLIIESREVGVVYYRAGYSPSNYPTQKEWDARLLLERSNAINCPSVAHQLVGAKKMQQILAQPGVLEKFIKDRNSIKRIRDTFTGFYGLEMGLDGDAAIEKVLANPDNYVLKPQLEGGGNNLYNDDLVRELKKVRGDNRRCSYIVMEKIRPMPVNTLFVRSEDSYDDALSVEGVSELGIFGVLIARGDEIVQNSVSGHVLRTKASHFDDGGLCSGVSVIDSPMLI